MMSLTVVTDQLTPVSVGQFPVVSVVYSFLCSLARDTSRLAQYFYIL